jgi:DNA-3-methyladenine glycosylase
MRIDRRLNGHDLTSDDFFIADPPASEPLSIVKKARVGVDYAGTWARRLLRFHIRGNLFVSKP